MTLTSGISPFLVTSATNSPRAFTKTESNAAALDGFAPSDFSDIGLISPSLATVGKPASDTLRATSPQLLETQALGEQVAASAVPGLGALNAAKSAGDKGEILALFDQWNGALATRDPDKVVAQYAPDAILLPTVSNRVRHNHAEIKDYFEHFLAKGPNGKIDEANVRQFGDVAINSGVYTFDFAGGDKVQARFTFVYRKVDGEWKIAEHHSSAMPERKTLSNVARNHLI
jgi:uncharacterized protein (TIGR02246 family)